jgi:hypothetical protein
LERPIPLELLGSLAGFVEPMIAEQDHLIIDLRRA